MTILELIYMILVLQCFKF